MRLTALEAAISGAVVPDAGECMPVHSAHSCKLTLERALKATIMLNLWCSIPVLVLTPSSYGHPVVHCGLS